MKISARKGCYGERAHPDGWSELAHLGIKVLHGAGVTALQDRYACLPLRMAVVTVIKGFASCAGMFSYRHSGELRS